MDRKFTFKTINECISCILEDSMKELQEISDHSYPLLNCDLRRWIWNLCVGLFLYNCGVPAQACHFLERNLFKATNNFIQINNGVFNSEMWNQYTKTLSEKFYPTVAASIYIAMKMYSKKQHQIADLRLHLLPRGINFTNEELMRAEYDIIKAYDFKMPVYSSLEVGTLLCKYFCLPEAIINAADIILSLAEMKYDFINEQLENHLMELRGRARILSLHLAAGAMYAALLCFNSVRLINIRKMEKTTGASFPYISCIAEIMLTFFR